jgi:hypothetical protein
MPSSWAYTSAAAAIRRAFSGRCSATSVAASPINESPIPRTLATSVCACTDSKKVARARAGSPSARCVQAIIGENPRFLASISDRLERSERPPVELDGLGSVAAAGCQLGEAA